MQYNNINNLSMTGGDDFTDISQILERCVLLDVNQTILSNKIFDSITNTTFDGDVELNGTTSNTGIFDNTGTIDNTGTLTNTGTINSTGIFDSTGTLNVGGTLNLTTDIVADKPSLNFTNTGSTIVNPSNIMALQVAGTDKFVTDATNTAISATTQLSLTAGTSTTTMTTASFQNNFGTEQLFSVNSNQKLQLQNTNTTLNNTTTSIQSGGTTKISVGASNTTLNNTTNEIQSGGTPKITTNATNITLSNDTIALTGSTGITISNTTGALRLWSPTMSFGYDTALTKICDEMAFESLRYLTIGFNKNGLGNGEFRVSDDLNSRFLINSTLMELNSATISMYDGTNERFRQTTTTTTITNTNIGTNGILIHTGNFTAKGTTITLQDATPTTRFSQTNGTTTITNTNIGTNGILTHTGNFTASGATMTLKDVSLTTHFLQNDGLTTITNQDIELTAPGTSGSITLTGGGSALNIGIDLDSIGTIRIDSDNDVRIQASDTIRIQAPPGSSRATFTAGTTTLSNTTSISLDHPTTTISSASASKMSITGTTSTFNNTGVVTLQSTASNVSISANGTSTEGILIKQNGTGGVRILSSTTSPLIMGTGTTNYASVSSAGVGATEYWVGSGGANSFPLSYPLMWMSTATTGQTTSQCRIGSFPDNNTAETFIRYRFPYRSRVRAMTLVSDGETINASQTYIHISVTNATGLDTSPNYAYWIYDAGVANPGEIVVTDNGSMTSVADIPANSTFYVFLAYGSLGISINSVGTARTVPAEFQVHLWIQQII